MGLRRVGGQIPQHTHTHTHTHTYIHTLTHIGPFSILSPQVPVAAFGPLFITLCDQLGLIDPLPVSPLTLLRFITTGRNRYWSCNSFHNQFHGMHVAQATFMLLRCTGANDEAVLPRCVAL
jgi:hypothetical protein